MSETRILNTSAALSRCEQSAALFLFACSERFGIDLYSLFIINVDVIVEWSECTIAFLPGETALENLLTNLRLSALYSTSRKMTGSSLDRSSSFFFPTIHLSLLVTLGTRVRSVSNRNEYQKQSRARPSLCGHL
jgi:hypothetical protein